MSLKVIDGAEPGINVAGGGTTTSVLWGQVNGTVGIDTGVFRSGAKAYVIVGGTTGFIKRTCASSRTIGYARFYFRVNNAAPSATMTIASFNSGNSHQVRVTTGGVLQANAGGATFISGPTIVANKWYGVEMQSDVSANPNVMSWRTWDPDTTVWTDQAGRSEALSASTISGIQLENVGPSAATTIYFDDVLIGEGTVSGEDYGSPDGGKVLRYLPTGDGTHSFTAGDFGYNAAGADVATNATDVNTYLDDDDQTSLADFIRQKVIRTAGYVEVTFSNEASETAPRAVSITSTHHSSSTAANQMSIQVSDDGSTWTTIWTNEDVSDTTIHVRHAVLAAPPSGGSWTQAKVNGMRARLGYSGDVTDIPYFDTISMQVAWTEVSAPAVSQWFGGGYFG